MNFACRKIDDNNKLLLRVPAVGQVWVEVGQCSQCSKSRGRSLGAIF